MGIRDISGVVEAGLKGMAWRLEVQKGVVFPALVVRVRGQSLQAVSQEMICRRLGLRRRRCASRPGRTCCRRVAADCQAIEDEKAEYKQTIIFASLPSSCASTSICALSVSTSSRTSPAEYESPGRNQRQLII